MVVDSSALLAVIFNESHGPWVLDQMSELSGPLYMSTVNLSECLILAEDRQPTLFESLKERILASGIKFVPVSVEHATIAAAARTNYPLNLGDCFAYALAKHLGETLLAVDADFKKCDVDWLVP